MMKMCALKTSLYLAEMVWHTMQPPRRVFLVHQKDEYAEAFIAQLDSVGIVTVQYDSAVSFLQDHQRDQQPGCLVVNLGQPAVGGEFLLDHLPSIPPVVVLTDEIDVKTAVRALRCDLSAFLLKQYVGHGEVLDAIEAALARGERRSNDQTRRKDVESRFAFLTQRENQVLQSLVDGEETQAIARKLNINRRTVEAYRKRLMAKLQVSTIPGLVALVIEYRGYTRPELTDSGAVEGDPDAE